MTTTELRSETAVIEIGGTTAAAAGTIRRTKVSQPPPPLMQLVLSSHQVACLSSCTARDSVSQPASLSQRDRQTKSVGCLTEEEVETPLLSQIVARNQWKEKS